MRRELEYKCDHCGYVSLVKAEQHYPRSCSRTNCTGTQHPVDGIIARSVRIIQKTGAMVKYTHVTRMETRLESVIGPTFFIIGETEDSLFGGRRNAFDKYPVENLLTTDIEWYLPEE